MYVYVKDVLQIQQIAGEANTMRTYSCEQRQWVSKYRRRVSENGYYYQGMQLV